MQHEGKAGYFALRHGMVNQNWQSILTSPQSLNENIQIDRIGDKLYCFDISFSAVKQFIL